MKSELLSKRIFFGEPSGAIQTREHVGGLLKFEYSEAS